MRRWYVTPAGALVNWSTAVVNGVATVGILELLDPGDPGGATFLTVWARAGEPVPAPRVAGAQAAATSDALPTARKVPPRAGSAVVAPVVDRSVLVVSKALTEGDHAAGSWPAARPPAATANVRVMWVGDTSPPAAAVLSGDVYLRVVAA